MSNKYIFVILAALLLAIFIWHRPRTKRVVLAHASPTNMLTAKPAASSNLKMSPPVHSGPTSTIQDSNDMASGLTSQEFFERTLLDPRYEWKRPISFFGKVVDEKGRPVEDAVVSFAWNNLQGTSRSGTSSDAQGLFQLVGVKGKLLTVLVEKTNFYTSISRNQIAFEYADPSVPIFHIPDPNNPVIFHLRRKGEAEPLVYFRKLFGFKPDGTLYYLDLVDGKHQRTPPGDLTVRFNRSEQNAKNKFDWSVNLAVPEGGLIESTEEFMFVAPVEGYEPSIEISVAADDPKWAPQQRRKFFIRCRNGQLYGRLELTILPRYNNDAVLDAVYFVNPSGSRNLEFSPDKVVGQQQTVFE